MQDDNMDISKALVLYPGDGVTIVVGEKTYRGTLVNDEGRWYVLVLGAEPGERKEVVIAKL